MKHLRPALVVIDRDVRIWLKEPHLPFAFDRHPAGGVTLAMQPLANLMRALAMSGLSVLNRHADRFDALDRRAHEARDHVDVMDHEI